MTAGTLGRMHRMHDDDLTAGGRTPAAYPARTSRTDAGGAIPANPEHAGNACHMRARQDGRSPEGPAESGHPGTYAPSIGDGDVDPTANPTAWRGPQKASRQ